MAIPSFYHSELSESDERVNLTQSEVAHAVKSRRLKAGQIVRLLNGQGAIAMGEIESVARRAVSIALTEFRQLNRSHPRLVIATAIPKGDRQRVMMDVLTQLGCSEIVPVVYEHSVTKFSEKMREKWLRITIEACKQSQNPWLPDIGDCVSVDQLVEVTSTQMAYADVRDTNGSSQAHWASPLTILIGPEGGFSPREYSLFLAHKMPTIRLGPHVLRTEAAAVAAAAQWAMRYNG